MVSSFIPSTRLSCCLLFLASVAGVACGGESGGSFNGASAAPAPTASVAPVVGEWPQFRGPNRDGISPETGFLKQWPAGGPAVQWRSALGKGFSGISVADGRIFTMFNRGGGEWLAAIDSRNGNPLWQLETDSAYSNSFGDGPRSTPTLDGALVYGLGARGKLVAA
ncbi:MAG: PQQ-binding-like beta-propeller repeat protein, partial [Acidobacteria bacterium]|nr:PQQ-binding-like beta-propeller repeat protein [Acidobacteriota bacterium]